MKVRVIRSVIWEGEIHSPGDTIEGPTNQMLMLMRMGKVTHMDDPTGELADSAFNRAVGLEATDSKPLKKRKK